MPNNYDASSIKTMSAVSHIRQFPSMYIPSPSTPRGQSHLVKEVVDNSYDEAENNPSVHHEVKLFVFTNKEQTKYQIAVYDNGRGVPIEVLTPAFSEPRTSGKWGDAYEDSTGVFGIGAKAAAILSNKFVALSKRDNKIGIVDIEKGNVVNEGFSTWEEPSTGTLVFFEPDPSIFANTDKFVSGVGFKDVMSQLRFMAAYTPNTTTYIYIIDKLIPLKFFSENMEIVWNHFITLNKGLVFKGEQMPVIDYIKDIFNLKSKVFADISFSLPKSQKSRLSYDITLLFMEDLKYPGGLISMVNKTQISGSSASQNLGFRNVLKGFLSSFIDDEDIKSFFDVSYNIPVYASLNIKWKKAVFSGQTKDNFEDNTFYYEYTQDLVRQLSAWDKDWWFNLYDHLKEDIERQYHDFINKGLKGGKTKNIENNLNKWSSYMGCLSTDRNLTELLIVEGDSAGGAIDRVRNSTYQAVFLLKGKPINPEKHPLSKVREDPVFQDLVKVIGVTPGSKDLEGLRFGKIGILTDADDDGYHIGAITLDILKTLSPKILDEGHVFVTNPPLYYLRMNRMNGQQTRSNPANQLFIRDYNSMVGVKIDQIYHNAFDLELQFHDGPVHLLDQDEFKAFCFEVIRVCRIINDVASILAINPEYLEMLVHCIDYLTPHTMDTEAIRKKLDLDRVEYRKNENTIVLSKGVIDTPVSLTNLVFDLKTYILPHLYQLYWSDIHVYMTTKHSDAFYHQPVSLMYLYREMEELDKIINVSRFKGLGQTPEHVLETTCINPDTRCIMPIYGIGDYDIFYKLLGTSSDSRKALTSD